MTLRTPETHDNGGGKSILMISALDLWTMGEGMGMPSVYKTVRGYADRGWTITYITGNRGPVTSGESLAGVRMIRFDAPWLKRLIRHKPLGFFAKAVWWLWFQVVALVKAQRLRSQCRPDVIYGATTYGVPVSKVLAKLWRIPVVSRFHGAASLTPARLQRPLWRLRYWDFLLAYGLPADLVIMTNDGTQGHTVLERLGVETTRVRFWMNGIDRELFGRLPPKAAARQSLHITASYTLLTVSRLVRSKRVDRSIRALPDVIRDFPETLLIVVGDGADRRHLERLARQCGVEHHVRFEGTVPHQQVPRYLAAADIFLSLYDLSNVGNPLLEALTAGTCIVTLDNGDTARFVQNGHTGILLGYEQLADLPAVLKGLLADESRRQRLGAQAREFAAEHFWTWEERMAAEVAAVSALVPRRKAPCEA
jgi:glycosyltransferase involved in cell wall biosynthesis